MITKKYYKLIRVSYEDMNYLTLTNTENSTGLFSVSKYGSPSTTNLEYSINGVDWTTYDLTNLPTVEVPVDGHIYLRGTNASGFNKDALSYYTLGMTTKFTASGNLFSLRNNDPATFSTYTSVLEGEFTHLFANSPITDAHSLITSQITSIGNYGMGSIFYNCENLLKPIDLSGVTSVGVSALISAFRDCKNLTSSPDFKNITSVASQGFTSLFKNCYMLNNVTAPNVSGWSNMNFQEWMSFTGKNVTGTKTFYAPTGLEIPTNTFDGIPSGWTRVDY